MSLHSASEWNGREPGADHEIADFDEWREFDDRLSVDRSVGPARKAKITGRCTNCWGPVAGLKHRDGSWNHIACRLCARAVDGADANRQAQRMQREAAQHMGNARLGRASRYDPTARFVLKILPDMNRDKELVDLRIAASLAAGSKRNWLGRREFPGGTPGYLYAQASALLSGLNNLRGEMSALSLSDLEFGQPEIAGVGAPTADATWQVSMAVPAIHRKPSDDELMARMGTMIVAGMTGAFACEVAMKSILLTPARQDTQDTRFAVPVQGASKRQPRQAGSRFRGDRGSA